ncbi:hypothetical protein DYB30_005661 [Aphanomyces astaci]|uniref:FYVE-type domain-containing protein n=1 Tax=Aphanomyces astaci TaxID=112090 RepID=A0A397CT35_APHAT|nr:hypothetical protein DYB30_005661 [Aphanomyces astaci]
MIPVEPTNPARKTIYGLEHFKSRREWVPDSARQHCIVCTKKFFLGGGKHHCRRCGDVVCSSCAPFVAAHLPIVGRTKVRVCHSCRVRDEAMPVAMFLSDRSSSEDEEAEKELMKKCELMLLSPSRAVMERIELNLGKKSLIQGDNRQTSASSTASIASSTP